MHLDIQSCWHFDHMYTIIPFRYFFIWTFYSIKLWFIIIIIIIIIMCNFISYLIFFAHFFYENIFFQSQFLSNNKKINILKLIHKIEVEIILMLLFK